MNKTEEQKWIKEVSSHLVGRTIVKVEYLSKDVCDDLDWGKRPVVLILDNDEFIYPSMDDEGNDGGALFTTMHKLQTIGTL